MEVFSDRNIISTAFKSTEKGVDAWIEKDKKKSAGTTAPNHQSGSSIVKNNNVISGQTLTDIITDIKGNLNLTRKQETFNSENPNIYYQSVMKKISSDNFADFYKAVLSKPKNTNDKEQFNAVTKDNLLNIRIPHDTIIHDENRHKLTADEGQDLLDNIDNVSYAAINKKKSRLGGTPILFEADTENNSLGVVVKTFAKNNPLISTAFIDTQSNIENWIENNRIKKAVPNGTKTTFLDISLINIITNINSKFKSKIIIVRLIINQFSLKLTIPHIATQIKTENQKKNQIF